MSKLTKSQRAALVTARDHGHAFAFIGCKQRAGGAYMRMVKRLVDDGLLRKKNGFVITDAGLSAIAAPQPGEPQA